jgi:Domain of unknown function (DUF383)/Domain of unknown function (DUF384)
MTASTGSTTKKYDDDINKNNSSTSSNNDEQAMYQDLKSFLLSPRPDLRIAATQAVVKTIQSDVHAAAARSGAADSCSENSSSMAKLVRYGLILPLVQNISYDNNSQDDDEEMKSSNNSNNNMDQVVAVSALKALVYLSSHGTSANQCIQDLLDAKCISRLVEIVLPSGKNIGLLDENGSTNNETTKVMLARARINYALALMANLTRSEQGAIELVGKTLPERAVPIKSSSNKDKKSSGGEDDDMPRVKPGMEILTQRFLNPAFIQPNIDYKQLMATMAAKEEEEAEADEKDDNQNNASSASSSASVAAAAALDSSTVDPYQHFAAVLMNVTQVEQGRNFLLQLHYNNSKKNANMKSNCCKRQGDDDNDDAKQQQDGEGTTVFQRLIPLIKTCPNPIRRRGLAGLIRNVCLDKDSAWWLLHVVQIPRYILYPLAGPEELELHEKQGLDVDLWLQGPDKEREADRDTRLFLVEALLLLCASGRVSRRRLRVQDKVPVILKWAEMVEEDEHVSERMNDCIQYLQRDEQEGEGEDEGIEDEEEDKDQCEQEDEDENGIDDNVPNAFRRQLTTTSGATWCPLVTTSANGLATTSTMNPTTIKEQQQRGDGEADFDDVD